MTEYYNEHLGMPFDKAFVSEWTGLMKTVITKFRGMPKFSVHEQDLEQLALIGLSKAYNSYNSEKAQFNTYAHHCMRNEIIQYLKKKDRMGNKELYDLSIHVPVNARSTENDDITLEDITKDDKFHIDQNLTEELHKYKVRRLVDQLSERDAYIFTSMLGVLDMPVKTAGELAEELGLKPAKVHGIRGQALIKLKKVVGDMTLEEFLGAS